MRHKWLWIGLGIGIFHLALLALAMWALITPSLGDTHSAVYGAALDLWRPLFPFFRLFHPQLMSPWYIVISVVYAFVVGFGLAAACRVVAILLQTRAKHRHVVQVP
jgi:hypothetical protein